MKDRQMESDIEEIRRSMRNPDLMDAFIGFVRAGTMVNSGERRRGKIVWRAADALSGEPQQPSGVPAIVFVDFWIFEVKGGVLLCIGEHSRLRDGWWFATSIHCVGPFASDQEALDAAASDAAAATELRWARAREKVKPVTDPAKCFVGGLASRNTDREKRR